VIFRGYSDIGGDIGWLSGISQFIKEFNVKTGMGLSLSTTAVLFFPNFIFQTTPYGNNA
jgi:hypothetical protein